MAKTKIRIGTPVVDIRWPDEPLLLVNYSRKGDAIVRGPDRKLSRRRIECVRRAGAQTAKIKWPPGLLANARRLRIPAQVLLRDRYDVRQSDLHPKQRIAALKIRPSAKGKVA